jgi:hypothetical protein
MSAVSTKVMTVLIGLAAMAAATMAGCTNATHHATGTARSLPTVAANTVAGNPVDLLRKLAPSGCKMDDGQPPHGQGDPDLYGGRAAICWWGTPWDTGQSIQVWTSATHADAVAALDDVTPKDHEAVIAGDLWMAEVDAPSTADYAPAPFSPTPAAIATLLGGRVTQVWP